LAVGRRTILAQPAPLFLEVIPECGLYYFDFSASAATEMRNAFFIFRIESERETSGASWACLLPLGEVRGERANEPVPTIHGRIARGFNPLDSFHLCFSFLFFILVSWSNAFSVP